MNNSGMAKESFEQFIYEHKSKTHYDGTGAYYYLSEMFKLVGEWLDESPQQESGKQWTDELITRLIGNWVAEVLTVHLADNLKGKINLTELSEKFQKYLTKFKEQKGIK